MNNNCDNPPCSYDDASVNVFIAACSMHDYDEDNRTVYAVLNLKQNYCGRRIVVLKLMTDTKHRAASLRQQSYLLVSAAIKTASYKLYNASNEAS